MESEIKQKKGRKKAFVPPTLDDVQVYMDKIGECRFTAVKFWNYYEAKGWMLGKARMRCWKIVLDNWIERENNKAAKHESKTKAKEPQNIVTFNAYKPVDKTGAVTYEEYLRMKEPHPLGGVES